MPTASRSLSPPRSLHTFSWFILIAANGAWATSYVAAKFALQETSVTMMLALRMSISALILLPFLIIKRKALHLHVKDLPQLLLLSLVGFVINKLFEFGGLALTTASDVALLITAESIFTAALSWLVLHERCRRQTVFALGLGFVGVYLIVEQSVIPTIPVGGGVWRIIGDLLVILALLIEAFYTVRGKALLVKHSPLLITSASIVGSTLFWVPVAGWEMYTTGWHMPGLLTLISIGWLALVCTVFAYLAWFQGLTRITGSAAASTLFIQPLLGTLLAIVLLHDHLTPATVCGGLLIIVSVYFISKQ